jgi:hypothetical protein
MMDFFTARILIVSPLEIQSHCAVVRKASCARLYGTMSALDCQGRTIWIADAHRDDGNRYVVYADEILTAFLELEMAISEMGCF